MRINLVSAVFEGISRQPQRRRVKVAYKLAIDLIFTIRTRRAGKHLMKGINFYGHLLTRLVFPLFVRLFSPFSNGRKGVGGEERKKKKQEEPIRGWPGCGSARRVPLSLDAIDTIHSAEPMAEGRRA